MDTEALFRKVMADAREQFALDGGTNDLFDYQLGNGTDSGPDAVSATQAVENALYRLANGELRAELTELGDPTTRVGGEDGGSTADWPDVIRKQRLRTRLQPHLDALVADCKQARYTGWSKESGGPVRRIR